MGQQQQKTFLISHSTIFVKSFFLTIIAVLVFSIGTYLLANDSSDDAAAGDYKTEDYYIAGLTDSFDTKDNYWSEALKGCRSGLQQNDYEKINSAIIELQSHCGYKCWQVYKTSGYWSPHGGPRGYGGLQPYEKCGTDPECTDTMESGLSHLKTLQKEHWLTAKNMPIYLKYYDQVIFSFWERVLLTGLAAFVLIYLYFYFRARILRRVMLRKEVIIRRCSDRVNTILTSMPRPYVNLPLVTEPTAKNIRVAVERLSLDKDDSRLVEEAVEILEEREKGKKN